jgi:hypothetical protein
MKFRPFEYEDYECKQCGYDRTIEGRTMICQHCGASQELPKNVILQVEKSKVDVTAQKIQYPHALAVEYSSTDGKKQGSLLQHQDFPNVWQLYKGDGTLVTVPATKKEVRVVEAPTMEEAEKLLFFHLNLQVNEDAK